MKTTKILLSLILIILGVYATIAGYGDDRIVDSFDYIVVTSIIVLLWAFIVGLVMFMFSEK